jgi:hypothetical protein
MKHELKIWPQYYCRIEDGSKTFEVRNNDRGFQPGDEVVLREWSPDTETKTDHYPMGDDEYEVVKGYTGKSLIFKIGYVLPIDAVRVVFSLLPPERK